MHNEIKFTDTYIIDLAGSQLCVPMGTVDKHSVDQAIPSSAYLGTH